MNRSWKMPKNIVTQLLGILFPMVGRLKLSHFLKKIDHFRKHLISNKKDHNISLNMKCKYWIIAKQFRNKTNSSVFLIYLILTLGQKKRWMNLLLDNLLEQVLFGLELSLIEKLMSLFKSINGWSWQLKSSLS